MSSGRAVHSEQATLLLGETPNPETLTQEQFLGLLCGLANHEAKLFTAAIITGQPDHWFSRKNIFDEVTSRQGPEPAWKTNKVLPGNYCDSSLGPIGAVTTGAIESSRGPIVGWKATEFGSKWGLAWAGGLMGWSLSHPNHSLQTLLGSSNSPSMARAPEIRYQIFSDLITSPKDEISIPDLYDSIGRDKYPLVTLRKNIKDLRALDVIDATSKEEQYNPMFKITDPSYSHITMDLEDTLPSTQAVYRAMEALHEEGIIDISLQDLAVKALELDSSVTNHAVHYQLVTAAGPNNFKFPGLQVTDRNGAPSQRTCVKLIEANTEAVASLVELIEELKDITNIEKYSKQALSIIDQPEACFALMEKARKASHNYAGVKEGRERLIGRILSIVESEGETSISTITQRLEEQGRPLNRSTVTQLLGKIASEGVLKVRRIQPEAHSKRSINVYSTPDKRQ